MKSRGTAAKAGVTTQTPSTTRATNNATTRRTVRQQAIAEVLTHHHVRSQTQLLTLLEQQGHAVTQATLSRDLNELGVLRTRQGSGPLIYALPAGPYQALDPTDDTCEPNARLARVADQLLLDAQANDMLVVVRTPAGAAQFLASAIDAAARSDVLGTVAGDDTIFLVAARPTTGHELAQSLMRMVKRRT